MKNHSAIILLILFCLVSNSARGDNSVVDANGAILTLSITQTIKESDYSEIVQKVNWYKSVAPHGGVYIFRLDSTGGNVSASLKIGRYLRKLHAVAEIEEKSVCLSSCVYVLAGAIHRRVSGSVGIHRPFDPNDEVTTEAGQKEKYGKIGKKITAYLKEMNIPPRLYEDSLFISPDNIKILTFNEMQSYGLNEDDPYHAEALESSMAKRYGISRSEYKKRDKRAWSECQMDTIDAAPEEEQHRRAKCFDAIMEGTR